MKRKGIQFTIVTEKGVRKVQQSHVNNAKLFPANIEKDQDGNEFFTIYNPYAVYGESRFKNFDKALYKDRADLAFKAVTDGYADTIVGHNHIFGGFGSIPDLEPVIFLDHKIGNKKRVEFEYGWKENLLGFSWAVKYYTGGWSDSILRDQDLNIVRFKSEQEASHFIDQVFQKVNEADETFVKLEQENGNSEKAMEYYRSVKHALKEENYPFFSLWELGMLQKEDQRMKEGSKFSFEITLSCIPDFKKVD